MTVERRFVELEKQFNEPPNSSNGRREAMLTDLANIFIIHLYVRADRAETKVKSP
jgi:hypothetical protein